MLKNFKDVTSLRLLALTVTGMAVLFFASYIFKLVSLLSDVVIVLLLSWLISFLFEPVVDRLTSLGLSRFWAALVVYALFTVLTIGLFVLALPIVVSQINTLLSLAPTFAQYVPGWANKILDVSFSVLENSVGLAGRVASFLFYFLFILILSFYILLDKQKIWQWFMLVVPTKYQDEAEFVRQVIDNTFAGFIRVQVVLGLIFGLIVFIFLSIFTPSFAVLGGLLAALLSIIPIIGPLLGLVPPFLAGLTLGFSSTIWLTLAIFILQQIELNVFAPKLWGKALRIHPIVVLLSFLVGLKVGGVWGSVFAVPIAAILVIITSELAHHYQKGHIGLKD